LQVSTRNSQNLLITVRQSFQTRQIFTNSRIFPQISPKTTCIFQNIPFPTAHARPSGNSWMNFLIFIPRCTFHESATKDIFLRLRDGNKGAARHRFYEKR
jgi:hypothetical protein